MATCLHQLSLVAERKTGYGVKTGQNSFDFFKHFTANRVLVEIFTAGDVQTVPECQVFFMAALCNRGPLYFCPVASFFYLLLLLFPRLISAATDWMSTILLHMAWP